MIVRGAVRAGLLIAWLATTGGCMTRMLWEGHDDSPRLLGRAAMAVDRMGEGPDGALAFRLAPGPDVELPPRLAEDLPKGYAWVRLRPSGPLGFLGRELAMGRGPWRPDRISIAVQRTEGRSGRLHHGPVLLTVAGLHPVVPLARVDEPPAPGEDLLDSVADHELRVALGLATVRAMETVPAEWGGHRAIDTHRWCAVVRDGRALPDGLAPLREAIERGSVEPLAGCRVLVRRTRPGRGRAVLHVSAPLDHLLFSAVLLPGEDRPSRVWRGWCRGRTGDAPDDATLRAPHGSPRVRALVTEWKRSVGDLVARVLLTPLTLAGDFAARATWAHVESGLGLDDPDEWERLCP